MATKLPLSAILAILSVSPALADGPPPTITVSHAWSRAMPPGAANGVIYLTIANPGPEDELLSAESAIADHVEMHENIERRGMMEMRPLTQVPIARQAQVRFEPGGKHLMLVGVKQPIQEGQIVPLTLMFRRAGAIHVQALAGGLGATEEPRLR